MNEIFISYSRKDLKFVRTLVDALNANGIDPWFDLEDIRPAVQWQQEILIAVQACHNFIYILSPNSVASEYCEWELNHALGHNKRIIPVLASPLPMDGIPYAIRELNWISFSDFEKGRNLLIETLESPHGISTGISLNGLLEIKTRNSRRQMYLYRNKYFIGRKPEGSLSEGGIILINDVKVSRSHATLRRSEDRWAILDGHFPFNNSSLYLSSSNGVFVNKRRIAQRAYCPLKHGDRINLSPDTQIIYRELSPDYSVGDVEDDKETMI